MKSPESHVECAIQWSAYVDKYTLTKNVIHKKTTLLWLSNSLFFLTSRYPFEACKLANAYGMISVQPVLIIKSI